MSSYEKPQWAHKPPPQYAWKLVEIKGGVQTAVYDLSQTNCSLLGRAADQVEITIHHESASRIHARIAFDNTGVPWLKDLQSTHGVTVNKKRLPTISISKMESNSTKPGARGVVLYPGDVLQFGASTRIYCLEGPQEFARGAIQKVNIPTKAVTSVPAQTTSSIEATAIRDEGAEAEEEIPQELTDDNIPEKYQKEWEKLKAKRHKYENLFTESDRIEAKGGANELTTGQQKQLQRNQERMTALEREIKEKEEELHRNVFATESCRTTTRHQAALDDDDDDDEFYDRTQRAKQNELQMNADGETEESLIAKWKDIREQRQVAIVQLASVHDKQAHLEQRLGALLEQGDEDAFYVQNDLDLIKDSKRKFEERKGALEANLTEVEGLLSVVNPKLKPDVTTGSLGEKKRPQSPEFEELGSSSQTAKTKPIPEQQSLGNALVERSESQGQDSCESVLPLPSSKKLECTKSQSDKADCSDFMMPPPSKKRPRILGPAGMPPPSDLTGTTSNKTGRSKPQVMGTLAALTSLTSSSSVKGATEATKDKKVNNDDSRQGNKQVALNNLTIEAGKQDVWQAPKDQDGSGSTKLNAKFDGRY